LWILHDPQNLFIVFAREGRFGLERSGDLNLLDPGPAPIDRHGIGDGHTARFFVGRPSDAAIPASASRRSFLAFSSAAASDSIRPLNCAADSDSERRWSLIVLTLCWHCCFSASAF
jgi:hypothetical protein